MNENTHVPHKKNLPQEARSRLFCSSNSDFSVSFPTLLIFGGIFRFLLILYGVYHDNAHALKYTDVDYYVYSDASSFIFSHPSLLASGPLAKYIAETWNIYVGDPYSRATYRYTPLLALFLLPNDLQPLFGKFLFASADLGIAWLLYKSLTTPWAICPISTSSGRTTITISSISSTSSTISPRQAKILVASIWLFNPFVANISTRGSSESLLGLIILLFLFLLRQGKEIASAILFGLAVHFKIYPIIYAPSVLAYFASHRQLLNWRQIKFAVLSFGSFMFLNLAMYSIWGMPFIQHTYLYHLTRLDHRHNFSHYFYQIYLSSSSVSSSSFETVANSILPSSADVLLPVLKLMSKIIHSTFVPQLLLSFGLGYFLTQSQESVQLSQRFGQIRLRKLLSGTHYEQISASSQANRQCSNLPLIFFIQTLLFTTFNRVCTSQYFMWSLWFLPLALPLLNLSWKKGLVLLSGWIAGQAIWLSIAYRLEFLGQPVFAELWVASLLFFAVNVGIVYALLGQLERALLK